MLPTLRWLRFGTSLVITAFFLWLAVGHIRFEGVVTALKHIQWWWLTVAMISLVCGYVARIYRWWWMLRACNVAVTFGTCAWPLIVGFAINNVVPFRAGDAFRIMGFREQLQTPAIRLLGTLVVERILDLTILLVFLLVGVVVLTSNGVHIPYWHTVVVISGLAIISWVFLSWGARLERSLCQVCNSKVLASRGWVLLIKKHLQQLAIAVNVVRSPERALKLLVMSAVIWSFEGSIFAAVAYGLRYDGRAFGPWFALATGSLSTLLPSSPGYVGTFDFFTISGLTAYGTNSTVAVATAFIVHGVLWLPLTIAGGTYLLFSSLRGRIVKSIEPLARPQEKT